LQLILTQTNSFQEIMGYLERQYDDILAEESRIKRNPRFRDNRVHALLYFITPTGHSLREIDIELMKRLSPRVNVIPVVGKADTCTPTELAEFKKRALLPFAIIGSEEEIIVNGRAVRGRQYPWGVVEVDNPQHSDFARLRSALLSSHLQDLKEITHGFLYENYRTEKLSRSADNSSV
ncbi:7430_t:CDS:2, partial [Gigaspora rosea]